MNNIIAVAFPMFEKKISEIKNKYLCYHMQMFAKDLVPFGKTYLKKHKLTLNAPIIQFCKLGCIISNHFNNFPPARQVKIIYVILNLEETRLHTLIKSSYKCINTVSQ